MKTSGITGVTREKLDSLTSLRFVAAMMVVMHHGYDFMGISFDFHSGLGRAVSFFFVLSGFVLAYAYPELDTRKKVLRFWWARFARIWPAHIAALLLLLILVDHYRRKASLLESELFANIFMVHAWIPLREFYFSFNSVSWSISTEFGFYLLFPLLILDWRKTWKIKLLGVFFLWLLIMILVDRFDLPFSRAYDSVGGVGVIYIHPLSRLLEFMVGIAACSLYTHYRHHLVWLRGLTATLLELSALVLLISAYSFSELLSMFGILDGVEVAQVFGKGVNLWATNSSPVTYVFIILIFAFQRGSVSKFISYPSFVLLGEISFSLYLVHFTVFRYFTFDQGLYESMSVEAVFILACLISILISYLIYSVIEIPSRKWLLAQPDNWISVIKKHPNSNYIVSSKESYVMMTGRALMLVFIICALSISMRYYESSYLTATNQDNGPSEYISHALLDLNGIELQSFLSDGKGRIKMTWFSRRLIENNEKLTIELLSAEKRSTQTLCS